MPTETRPILTVAVPAYNRGALLRRCLESVLSQATDEIELLVSDDSTEEAPGIIARDLLDRARLRTSYTRNDPSLGMAANWNACIRLATGRYVLLLHDDDFLYPGAVSLITRACRRRDWDVGLFGVEVVNAEERRVRRRRPRRSCYLRPETALRRVLSHSSFIRFPGMVVSRSAYDTVGMFDESIGSPADLAMWIRLFSRYGLHRFSGVTAGYRVHQGSLTSHMWEPHVVSAVNELFTQAIGLGLLGADEIERCRASWFHRFLLAGAVREIRNARPGRARVILQLFDAPELTALGSPPGWAWLRRCVSFAASKDPRAGDTTARSAVRRRSPGSEREIAGRISDSGARLRARRR